LKKIVVIVVYNGGGIRRMNTRFIEALYLKHLAEEVRNVIVMLGGMTSG